MKGRLTSQVVMLVLLSVFISTLAILLTAAFSVSSELTRQQHQQTERIVTHLAETLTHAIPGGVIQMDGGDPVHVVIPSVAAFNDSSVVDQSVSIGGGAATIFSFESESDHFRRRLTSIKNQKGERVVGTDLAADSPAQAFVRQGKPYYGPTVLFGHRYYAIYQPTFDSDNHVNGILFAGSPMEQLYDAGYHNIMWQLGLVSVVLTALIAVIVSSVANRMFNPLRALARRVDGLTHGDLIAAIPGIGRHDEIGSLAKAIEQFQASVVVAESLRTSEEQTRRFAETDRVRRDDEARMELENSNLAVFLLGAGLDQLAQGNLVHEITTPLYPAAEKLRIDLNDASHRLRETMSHVAAAAHVIQTGTVEIAATADDISHRTEEQAAGLEETSTALAQITGAVAATASRLREAKEFVAAAKINAEDGSQIVGKAISAMSEIASSARQISQIISVIDEIALQTNLLALNAGVEAARAGDAGRGFAVVAQEVRALAQRSAAAAKEIKSLIAASARHVDSGVGLVGQTGQSLTHILDEVAQINALVLRIATSAQEQEASLQHVNSAVVQMNQATQQNAALVEESAASIHVLARQADSLENLMQQFQIGSPHESAASYRMNDAA